MFRDLTRTYCDGFIVNGSSVRGAFTAHCSFFWKKGSIGRHKGNEGKYKANHFFALHSLILPRVKDGSETPRG